jgi:hypothetical protein
MKFGLMNIIIFAMIQFAGLSAWATSGPLGEIWMGPFVTCDFENPEYFVMPKVSLAIYSLFTLGGQEEVQMIRYWFPYEGFGDIETMGMQLEFLQTFLVRQSDMNPVGSMTNGDYLVEAEILIEQGLLVVNDASEGTVTLSGQCQRAHQF